MTTQPVHFFVSSPGNKQRSRQMNWIVGVLFALFIAIAIVGLCGF